MPWLQLKCASHPQHVDAISDWLTAHGALSVTYQDAADQPLYEPPPGETPLWQDTIITGLFEAQTDLESLVRELPRHFTGVTGVRMEILEDKDWVREWMSRYRPMQFGESLWIVPSHHAPPDPRAVNILLDPGLAFGTGTHPTTAMCLRWLASHPPRSQAVVDYGCGSGILAIAAAKLGASHVIAVDNDPQALQATQYNAEQNHVSKYIECRDVTPPLQTQCDTLLANILAGPLISLAPRFAEIVRPGGNIVLSGILAEQADSVRHAYAAWFDFQHTAQQEEWVLLNATHRL
ncbi:MAG: 50S ribosomal protein L11 methyltransferase [Gammaproteobacteria bacterium]|nr:50S ribosomal protein L11 methyltransferase [Gammaproteobacteria bacterium]